MRSLETPEEREIRESAALAMDVQTYMMHSNPYDFVKSETPSSPPSKTEPRKSNSLLPPNDLIFGNFNLQGSYCMPINNNHEQMINHNVKMNSGRSLAADRKRPYPCDICPSRFGSKMELEEHQNSHTGQKPFECDVCKARFNRRSTLWNHKRIHSDAKPFVCTVCQMTFKWKNSLKCHKEMHQRKNESSAHLDADLKQLTYATAAKRRLMQDHEDAGGQPTSVASIHSQPLITTTTPKKKSSKSNNRFQSTNGMSGLHLNSLVHQPLQASSLIPPSDHQLDLDTSSLDTLVNPQHSNILLQMYTTSDMDQMPRHATGMLSGLDDGSMIGGHMLGDGKAESPMGGAPAPLHLPMQFINFGRGTLPSVHHLTSTSLPSVSIDYSTPSDLAHPQYIVTTQPDMMLGQHGLGYPTGQFQLDQCVILAAPQDYVPNFDYHMLSNSYQMPSSEQDHQMDEQDNDEKILPYEQW